MSTSWTKQNQEELRAKRARAEEKGGLTLALWEFADCSILENNFRKLWSELTALYGKSPYELNSVEEFWHPALKEAVTFLMDEKFTEDMVMLSRMRMDSQFSHSVWRRSYRSTEFRYHAVNAVVELGNCIYLGTELSLAGMLLVPELGWLRGYNTRLALEVKKENQEIISLIREAISGDNSEIKLTSAMIYAVIVSGHEELLELLIRLLIAAKLQEGVRQQILENADAGSVGTLIKFLNVCIDENLFRYSSVIRAFGTWTGLNFDNEKSSAIRKVAMTALTCLTDECARKRYLNSENNLEAYLALWGAGCYEVGETDAMARKLLDDPKKYRRILGWLFVYQTGDRMYKMRMAKTSLEERDEEILAWVVSNLAVSEQVTCLVYSREEVRQATGDVAYPAEKEEREHLFFQLKEIALFIGKRTREFCGNPFSFSRITLENTQVLWCMMSLAVYDMDQKKIDELYELISLMNVDQRRVFYSLLQPKTNQGHRRYMREALSDRTVQIKELAVERLTGCVLAEEDISALCRGLQSKSSALRQQIVKVFSTQKEGKLQSAVVDNLLSAEDEYQIQAGIELLIGWKGNRTELPEMFEAQLRNLSGKKLSTQTRILLEQLDGVRRATESFPEENGFGLYDPKVVEQFVKGLTKPQMQLLSEDQLKKIFTNERELTVLFDRINLIFSRHADYEYEVENVDGSRRKILFGDASYLHIPNPVPFYEEFVASAGVREMSVDQLLGICYATGKGKIGRKIEYQSWFQDLDKRGLSNTWHDYFIGRYGKRYWQMQGILESFLQEKDSHHLFERAMLIYCSMINVLGAENLGRNYLEESQQIIGYGNWEEYPVNHHMIWFWRRLLKQLPKTSEEFAEWFLMEYRIEYHVKVKIEQSLDMEDYLRAHAQGMIPLDVLNERLLLGNDRENHIRCLTNTRWKDGRGKAMLAEYPWVEDVTQRLVARVVEIEAKRGELVTALTGLARAIQRFQGAEYFCSLLAALGKETFFRGYEYSGNSSKQAVLSQLLKRCYPAKEDTAEKLKDLLKQTDIREKRLVEAVMYAPQWAGFAEKILQWPGLKCGVWFFHAHINEMFSAEKETEVALYSPITPLQFNDGAFDKNWFFEAYEQLGAERFDLLYRSAKYITSGSNQHRRSQLYTDAVLGRLDADDLKAEIVEKRNQEKLRCYPLIPIKNKKGNEALERYEFIQRFLKESKQFGSQRRESEKTACATAMENLAITTGFMDVNRMTWYLESEKMETIRPLMEPRTLGEFSVYLEIQEDGMAELAVKKDGKRLKTLPKALGKDETVLALKESVKELREQRRRARESLERAMVECTAFGLDELKKISAHPVLAPLIGTLIWSDGQKNGFIQRQNGTLMMVNHRGKACGLSQETMFRVAHPCDLMKNGEWADYMRYLYENRLTQPFKQVFREYYGLTEDERQEKTVSRRYAGHQVQPRKAVALLKDRGWTVDYETGLQKVFYKENLVVHLLALADWFSPADIEAPTIEIVEFYDRKTGESVELEKIPPILFSEVMRDIDLTVSVAHVGGVDPEASQSTVEMRTAIAAELLRLLKLPNVQFVGTHAKIHGSMANYSVHMGSGVVHGEAIGMIAVLPVHSQARGRIFLPFADEDPKTAEIMSKIILLAEDQKIKDPGILSQIRSQKIN